MAQIDSDERTSAPWSSRLVKTAVLGPGVAAEVTPFVFNGRLYRLENFPRSKAFPLREPQYDFHCDEIRVRDVERDCLVSLVLRNHYFGAGFVWENRVYVFAGDYEADRPWWHIRRIVMTSSDDLIRWTPPRVVLESENNEHLFNTAVCRGPDGFIMLYETNDARWPPFTFKYCRSQDLVNWTRIPDAIYGHDKYVGGPALYFEGDWYYTLYLHAMGSTWETRITRSRDLVHWTDAPEGRPFLPHNPRHRPFPELFPDVYELNASDAELCEWQGRTLVYFLGGNQQGVNDLQVAEFAGSPRELLEHYFEP